MRVSYLGNEGLMVGVGTVWLGRGGSHLVLVAANCDVDCGFMSPGE